MSERPEDVIRSALTEICEAAPRGTLLNPFFDANRALAALVADRDKTVHDYKHGSQKWVDAVCHYRNLAISLGAKPDSMMNQYDRGLAERHDPNVPLEDRDGWWDDQPELWQELDAAEADRDRYRVALEQLIGDIEDDAFLFFTDCMTAEQFATSVVKAKGEARAALDPDAAAHQQDENE